MYKLRYNTLFLSLQTDYQLMVISNGTNPISSITFLAVLMNFTFLFSIPSIHSTYCKSPPPSFLHLNFPPPSPPFSWLFLYCSIRGCWQVATGLWALLKAPPQLSVQIPLFSQSLTPLTLEWAKHVPLDFHSLSCPALSETLITFRHLLKYGSSLYRKTTGSQWQHHVCSALAHYGLLQYMADYFKWHFVLFHTVPNKEQTRNPHGSMVHFCIVAYSKLVEQTNVVFVTAQQYIK